MGHGAVGSNDIEVPSVDLSLVLPWFSKTAPGYVNGACDLDLRLAPSLPASCGRRAIDRFSLWLGAATPTRRCMRATRRLFRHIGHHRPPKRRGHTPAVRTTGVMGRTFVTRRTLERVRAVRRSTQTEKVRIMSFITCICGT